MKGSEFIAANRGKSLSQWETSAVALVQTGGSEPGWPLVPVQTVSRDGKHTGTFFVTADYFAIGIPEDYVRLPLTPVSAQRIANAKGMLLPTSKMVEDIWRSGTKLTPEPMIPNKGANLTQYADHSFVVDTQLRSAQGLHPSNATVPISGHKKDVILSNIWKPGKVVIYGWYRPDGTYIQGKSNIHGDFYVDYSHGIRFVSPTMVVDGQNMNVEDVLKSPTYAGVLSNEGPLLRTRYPTPAESTTPAGLVAAATSATGRVSYYKLGTSVLLGRSRAA